MIYNRVMQPITNNDVYTAKIVHINFVILFRVSFRVFYDLCDCPCSSRQARSPMVFRDVHGNLQMPSLV